MPSNNRKPSAARAPLTPEQRAELLRRRDARLAAQRGERPAQPLTDAQKKRIRTQRAAEQKMREKQQKQREKQQKKQQKAARKQQKMAQKQQRQGEVQRPDTERQTPPARVGNHTSARRARRRRTIITIIVLLCFIVVGAVLSVTVLFKIDSYSIEGDSIYTQEQLISAFGHPIGENMFRFSLSGTEESMRQALPYLETLKVRRRLPGTVVFLVTPAQEYAAIDLGDGNAVILSRTMRVLAAAALPAEGLLRIVGAAPQNLVPGQQFSTGDETKDAQLALLVSALQSTGIEHITSIDLSDQYELTAVYAGRITIKLGTESQLEYKLSVVQKALEAGSADGTFTDASGGTLDASSAGTVYYRP